MDSSDSLSLSEDEQFNTFIFEESSDDDVLEPSVPVPTGRGLRGATRRRAARRGTSLRARANRGARNRGAGTSGRGTSGRGIRGRRASRGRGRGRGRRFTLGGFTGRHVQAHVAARREERRNEIREILLNLTPERCLDLLLGVVERDSGLLLDLLNAPPVEALRPAPAPGWCSCLNCRPMPRDVEMLCCGLTPENCISQTEHFRSMLDPFFVNMQRRMFNNIQNREDDNQAPGAEHNRMRWGIYRSFVLWQHGRLGMGNRVVVPSCVVSRCRDEYPDPNGHYTGWLAANLCELLNMP